MISKTNIIRSIDELFNRIKMPKETEKKKDVLYCSICNKEICKKKDEAIYSHNAYPINDGSCCTECNKNEVIPARMKMMNSSN